MSWTAVDIPDQSGRIVVVTGANSGLGLQIATRLAERGARVVLACRNQIKAQAAADYIRTTMPDADVQIATLDLGDLSSVAAFADRLTEEHDRLHLLINNAGLMAVDQASTVDGFEMQFGVNHLGHFALTARLLPLLGSTPGSRVATMSSMGARAGRMNFDDLMGAENYRRWRAYFQSKLANLLFTAHLQRRLAEAGSGTIAVAAHPGASRTDLGSEGGSLGNSVTSALMSRVAQPVALGALPMLRAATDPGVTGGQFYGPRFVTAGHPVQETPSSRARNAADAERLWEASAALVHPFA